MTTAYALILVCALGHLEIKAELELYVEDVTIEFVDPEWMDPEGTDAFITDENAVATNVTIVKKLPAETKGHMKILAATMGKYIVLTGVDWTMNLCQMTWKPSFSEPILTSMGITTESCPPEAGNYFQPGYRASTEVLPKSFLENRYLQIVELTIKGKPIYILHNYFETQNEMK